MEHKSQRQIQENLINRLILIIGIFAVPVVLSSVLRSIDTGWNIAFIIHIAVGGTIVSMAFFRKHLPYRLKSILLVVLFFILAISWLISTGPLGNFIPYLMLAILVTVIFSGRRKALFVYIVCAVVIVISGFLYTNNMLATKIELNDYPYHISSWVNTFVAFAGLTGMVVMVIGDIANILINKIAKLEAMNRELTAAMNEIKILQGILPICARCKNIRDSNGYWTQVESYLLKHSELRFSHSLCEKCSDELYGKEDWYKEMQKKK